VEINARGEARPAEAAGERLAAVPGLWRLVPEIGRLMVLERVVDNRFQGRGGAREVKLAGVFDRFTDLAAALELIHQSQLDGAFHVAADQVRKTLYFRHGVYLSGRSNLEHDRLGNLLVRAGQVAPEIIEEIAGAVGDGSPLGAQLVARKLLTTPQVYDALRRQAEEIFYSVLRLSAGTWFLTAPLDMTEVPAMLRLDVQELTLEGTRRLDEAGEGRAGDGDAALRRRPPIPPDQLPSHAARTLVGIYDETLRGLFAAIGDSRRGMLRAELVRFLADAGPYQALFAGVAPAADGSLGAAIVTNVLKLGGEPLVLLQQGLSELFFFLLYTVDDALDPTIEHLLVRDVNAALDRLAGSRR